MADDGYGSVDVHEKEVVRMWRIWRTVHEMIADRVCCRRHTQYPLSSMLWHVAGLPADANRDSQSAEEYRIFREAREAREARPPGL